MKGDQTQDDRSSLKDDEKHSCLMRLVRVKVISLSQAEITTAVSFFILKNTVTSCFWSGG